MKILFSYPDKIDNEISLINNEMNSGKWDLFHLRKHDWSDDEVMKLWSELSDDVKRKTILHQNFKGSCHSFEEVKKLNDLMVLNSCHPEFIEGKGIEELNYCFLSPVFDSISKQGYKAKFDKQELKKFLQKERRIKIIALGGVTEGNYPELIEMGFDGGAFLGSVWKKYVIVKESSEVK